MNLMSLMRMRDIMSGQDSPEDNDDEAAPAVASHLGDATPKDVEPYDLEGPDKPPDKSQAGEAESNKPGEPGSSDVHSALQNIITQASQEGPSVAAYRELLKHAPTPDQYKPSVLARIGAGLSGAAAGLTRPGSGYSVAHNQLVAPFNEAQANYRAKLHDVAGAAALEQGGKNKLASLAGTMTYRDFLAKDRKDRLDEQKRVHEETARKNKQSEADRADAAEERIRENKERDKDREELGKERRQRADEFAKTQELTRKDIEERTKGRQQQEEMRGAEQTDADVLNHAKSIGYEVPTDKNGKELYSPGTVDDAASYIAYKEAMHIPGLSNLVEEDTNNKTIGPSKTILEGQRSALGAFVYNKKKQLRPHAYKTK